MIDDLHGALAVSQTGVQVKWHERLAERSRDDFVIKRHRRAVQMRVSDWLSNSERKGSKDGDGAVQWHCRISQGVHDDPLQVC